MASDPEAQITMSRIPIRGGAGAFVLIVILVAGVLADLPQLRGPFLGGVGLGLLFAVALIIWRRRMMDSHTLPPGAHTMFAPGAAEARDGRDRPRSDEGRGKRSVTRTGAHPRVAPAS